MDLLRLATAGSVDDGKSTLVGRLLYDAKAVLADQLAAIERVSRGRGMEETDLALLTDGLRAEREQGITIDVAYRYFATGRRRFILADTPGHVQYTRNMVCGASNAELVVVLADVRNGTVEQTRRHAAVAALLRVPHVVLAVNKMDLAGWSRDAFEEAAGAFAEFARGLGIPDVTAIPTSALRGDNVVDRSDRMAWYGGPSVLEHLETVTVAGDDGAQPARLPVQYVIRGDGYRGYAGRVASGVLRAGDEVLVLPSGVRGRVAGIDRLGAGDVDAARAGQSVTVRLVDDVDVARGDVIVPAAGPAPCVASELDATVCWLADTPLHARDRVLVKHTTRVVSALVGEITDRLDVASLERAPSPPRLVANDIGGVRLRTASPLALDPYAVSRRTGSFLVIDAQDGATLGAGMVGGAS
jgi:sulfate adenylyltransferase subunit 1